MSSYVPHHACLVISLISSWGYSPPNFLKYPSWRFSGRLQGFVLAVKHMRSFIPVIYNITLTVAKDEPRPSMLTIFKGRPSVVSTNVFWLAVQIYDFIYDVVMLTITTHQPLPPTLIIFNGKPCAQWMLIKLPFQLVGKNKIQARCGNLKFNSQLKSLSMVML